MASGGLPQIFGTMIGAATSAFINNMSANDTRHSMPENRNRNAQQNRVHRSNQFKPHHNDFHSRKVVKTLERLVDAKEEAHQMEMIRRRKAELEVTELQLKLEKFHVKQDTKQQVNSAVKQGTSSGKIKPNPGLNVVGGSRRGGYSVPGRGGYNNNTSAKANNGHPGPSKFNNSNNNSQEGGYNKVYKKQLFDSTGSTTKINNNGQQRPPLTPCRGRPSSSNRGKRPHK